jgi:hypothetical protein
MPVSDTLNMRRLLVFCATVLLLATACDELVHDPGGGDVIDALEDNWRVEEESQIFSKSSYIVEIERHPTDSTRIYVDNFYNVDATVQAVVTNRNISIPDQVMEGGYRVYGSGTVSVNNQSISWQYTVDDGSGQLDNVTAVYTRL